MSQDIQDSRVAACLPVSTADLIVRLRKELAGQGLDAGPRLVTSDPRKRPKSSYIRFAAELPTHQRVTGPIVLAGFRAAVAAHGTLAATLTGWCSPPGPPAAAAAATASRPSCGTWASPGRTAARTPADPGQGRSAAEGHGTHGYFTARRYVCTGVQHRRCYWKGDFVSSGAIDN